MLCGLGIFAGCQATPKKEIVVGKDEDQIQRMIESANKSNEHTYEVNYELIQNNYKAPDKMQCVITSDFEGCAEMEIRVDAPIIIPEYTLPMYKIVYTDIPYENLKNVIDKIAEGENIYHSTYASRVSLKSDIQWQIDCYNYEMEHAEGNSKERYKKEISKLFTEYEDAPSTYDEAEIKADLMDENTQIVKTITGESYPVGNNGMKLLTEEEIGPFELNNKEYTLKQNLIIGEGIKGTPTLHFTAVESDGPFKSSYDYPMVLYKKQILFYNNEMFFVNIVTRDIDERHALISLDDAKSIANEYAQIIDPNLKISDIAHADRMIFTDNGIQHDGYGYAIFFSKQYNSVAMKYTHGYSYYSMMKNEQDSEGTIGMLAYIQPRPQEFLKIIVGMDGIIGLSYNSPSQIVECISNNVELLPFEKVETKFKEHIRYNGYEEGKIYMNINRIELNMMAIALPDTDNYLVVPVWDFYGGAVLSSDTSALTEEQYWNEQIFYHYGRSFLTINAVNGSIIDRGEGH